ncbi:MAG: PLP-dependent transferase [Lachnospiraceae bacterium]|nr:PLP-dependent transferase [Lachnospiraceae bacterium]
MNFPEPYLYDRLKALAESDYYPYHMPGHKRNMKGRRMDALYEIDITEIDEFDNLHAPEGILKDAMRRAADFNGSEHTYFLVNGSSCGILSALMACAAGGGRVLMGRNAHKSAYHALYLGAMQPVYVMPEIVREYGFPGGIRPDRVRLLLEREENIDAVFITSPTYDGILSDIKEIVRIAHEKKIPVIVDEAHGAHFPLFSEYETAVSCGADLVIQSIHKTLPAPTQTALLHVNGTLVDREKVERYLQIFQTSSPSYVLMSGMDECFRLLKGEGAVLTERFRERRRMFDHGMQGLSCLRVYGGKEDRSLWASYGIKNVDMGKLVISAKNMLITGKELYERLRMKYHLQMEMSTQAYVLAMLTILDSREGWKRLAEAVIQIDRELLEVSGEGCSINEGQMEQRRRLGELSCYGEKNPVRMPVFAAQNAEKEWIPIAEAEGRIAAGMVNLYPPGVPILVPGEEIIDALIEFAGGCLQAGLNLQGICNKEEVLIPVVREFQ